MPEGITVVNRDGKILYYNQAARKVTGMLEEDLIGRQIADIDPEAWKGTRQIINSGRALLNQKVLFGENTFIVSRSPVCQDGEVASVVSVFRDMSEYENMARELTAYKELSEQLDVIIESSHDGLWITDANGIVVKVNAASAKRLGLPAESLVGCDVQRLVDEGYFDRSATLEVLKNHSSITFTQNMRDGGQCLVTGNPVFNEKGELRLVVINDRDLTAIKKLQDELEESRAYTQHYRYELVRSQITRELDSQLVVRSAPMRRVLETAMRVARTESSVLIQGESGVGKGLVAKVIHEASARRKEPMVRVDCGAIPPSLIEAELFGYEGGAFTGALDAGKPGYFEIARGGTLFLDEVGELPLNVQAKLLRFLDDKEVVRVGSTKPLIVDVRVLAATHRNLQEMVAEGSFRKDLFFRLSVVPLSIPPLRERADDVPPLVTFFLRRLEKQNATPKTMAPAVLERLRHYSFPGNIRELANLVEQLVVLNPDPVIELHHLPEAIRDSEFIPTDSGPLEDNLNLAQAVKNVEMQLIKRALKVYGSQRRAAKHLGVSHATISRKISQFNMIVTER
ncbi:MAG: sigma 54-interacting transcriptional regulator [Desulfarculaceae bacterium]|nr:sigma 54-interacting transcriptional regulator [Desulfarculaceae bacterium]